MVYLLCGCALGAHTNRITFFGNIGCPRQIPEFRDALMISTGCLDTLAVLLVETPLRLIRAHLFGVDLGWNPASNSEARSTQYRRGRYLVGIRRL
jgi:hypothetical protein